MRLRIHLKWSNEQIIWASEELSAFSASLPLLEKLSDSPSVTEYIYVFSKLSSKTWGVMHERTMGARCSLGRFECLGAMLF